MSNPTPTAAEEKLCNGVAVITGAGAGIGSAFAIRAAQLGMTVYVTDISLPRAASTADTITRAGGTAIPLAVDVSKPAELDRLAAHVKKEHGPVRLLINNAGIETLGLSWEIPPERWEATLNINIHGVVHGVRAFVPDMIESGQECWVANLASIGAFTVMPTQTAYIMTKHAVQAFSEGLYTEMALKGLPIHVSSVLPGMLKTSIFDADAGQGEPEGANTFRRRMMEMMRAYGMDLQEGCNVMMKQIAEGKFWVSSQSEMTASSLDGRVQFFRGQKDPEVAAEAKHLLGL